MNIVIEKAKLEDIPSVMSLCDSLLIGGQDGVKDHSRQGFLVYPNKKQELVHAIEDEENIFLVAKEENQIIGYILSYSLSNWERIKSNWRKSIALEGSNSIPFGKSLYYRHLACKSKYVGRGLALINKLHAEAIDLEYENILGEISANPPNTSSRKIHERKGYFEIGEVSYGDSTEWKLFLKILS